MSSEARFFVKSSVDMCEVGDNSVDIILTTPPEWRMWMMNLTGGSFLATLRECFRVLKPKGFFFYNVGTQHLHRSLKEEELASRMFIKVFYPYINGRYITSVGFIPVADIVAIYDAEKGFFFKEESEADVAQNQFLTCYEHWLVFSKGPWKLKKRWANVVKVPITFFETDEGILRDLMQDFSEKGDLVLDPWAGTGTTGKVALAMGRRAVMYDRDTDMIEKVKRKIPEVQIIMGEKT